MTTHSQPVVTCAVAALLLTGCAASYMMGYASESRKVCVRWTLSPKGDAAEPLECVEVEAP